MGHEIKMHIGRASALKIVEPVLDKARPLSDGSGYETKLDEKGERMTTGRELHYFMQFAELDLCKLGYQDDALNNLIQDSFKRAEGEPNVVHYFYGADGNTQVTEDRYGCQMSPTPIREVLAAINKLDAEAMKYRRLKWVKALLESMADDTEEISVLFFGH